VAKSTYNAERAVGLQRNICPKKTLISLQNISSAATSATDTRLTHTAIADPVNAVDKGKKWW